jgi:hypothetical protein
MIFQELEAALHRRFGWPIQKPGRRADRDPGDNPVSNWDMTVLLWLEHRCINMNKYINTNIYIYIFVYIYICV